MVISCCFSKPNNKFVKKFTKKPEDRRPKTEVGSRMTEVACFSANREKEFLTSCFKLKYNET